MKVRMHQPVEGANVGDEPEVDEKRAQWLVTNGYASVVDNDEKQREWAPTEGRTGADRDADPTLAENREGPDDPAPEAPQGATRDPENRMTQPAGGDYFMPPADTTPDPEFRNAYDQRGRGQVFDNDEAPQFVDQRRVRSEQGSQNDPVQPRKGGASDGKPGQASAEPQGSSSEGKGKKR